MTARDGYPDVDAIEVLGRGGTAEVARALPTGSNRPAALKYALPDDPEAQAQFPGLARREYDLIGAYRFPGLVRLLRKPAPADSALLLELCDGPTLDQIGRIDNVTLAMNLLSALALDLEYLRAIGLAHGDLKPQNVFLPPSWRERDDNFPFYVKLSDFSLAARMDDPSGERLGLGTVGYIAPETIADRELTHRSDLFALGVIAYQLVSGRHPFMSEDTEPVRVNARVQEDDPEPLTDIRDDLPDELIELIATLLAKDPENRPGSAWTVCQTLAEIGATFPYTTLLSPVHLLRVDCSYHEQVATIFSIDDAARDRLDNLTDCDLRHLRLISAINYRRGNLHYVDTRFQIDNHWYWPSRCRRVRMDGFSNLSSGQKRQTIRASIIGSISTAHQLDVVDKERAENISPATLALLEPLLRPATVRREATYLAPVAERADYKATAARLYVKAGNLTNAERLAYEAAVELRNDLKNTEAIRLLGTVISYAELTDFIFSVRKLLLLRAEIHKENGELEFALAWTNRLIDICANCEDGGLEAKAHNVLGDIRRLRNEHSLALEALQEALERYRRLDNQLEISRVLNNMGNTNWIMSQMSDALRCYREALSIQRKLDARKEIASTLNNTAGVYVMQGRFDRGLTLANLALNLQRELGHKVEIARSLNNIGYINMMIGRNADAVRSLRESLELNRQVGSKHEILYNLENLISILITSGKLSEGLSYSDEAIGIANSLGDRARLASLYDQRATMLRRLGDIGGAHDNLNQATELATTIDSVSLEIALKLQRSQLRYVVGNVEDAVRLAAAAFEQAQEANERATELNILLQLLRYQGRDDHRELAEQLCDEMHLQREKRLTLFYQIEGALLGDETGESLPRGQILLETIDNVSDDLELPRMLNAAGHVLILEGAHAEAAETINRACSESARLGLLDEQMQAFVLSGRCAKHAGDYERAFGDYKQALEICKQLSRGLPPEDQSHFQTRPTVQFLAGEIRALAEMLAHRKNQGR